MVEGYVLYVVEVPNVVAVNSKTRNRVLKQSKLILQVLVGFLAACAPNRGLFDILRCVQGTALEIR